MYKGGSFCFTFSVNQNYPHEPPKVKCSQKVGKALLMFFMLTPFAQLYHPNLDLDGNVCLNILREDWKPVLNLNSVMVGLQFLFLEPNADDPLNKGTLSMLFCPRTANFVPLQRQPRICGRIGLFSRRM